MIMELLFLLQQLFFYIDFEIAAKIGRKGRDLMKQEEKKPIPWEVADPELPVVQAGKMESRKQNRDT